jgi:hypothetical protein
MQPYFKAANNKKLIYSLIQQVRKAKKQKCSILILEYKNCGKTNSLILKHLVNYNNVIFESQSENSGAKIINKLINDNIIINNIKICGINTDCCVKETVNDLLKNKKVKIELLADCCFSEYTCNHFETLNDWIKSIRFSKNKNFKITFWDTNMSR